MSPRVYDMSAAWALHILLLVVIGVGWGVALVWSLTRPARGRELMRDLRSAI